MKTLDNSKLKQLVLLFAGFALVVIVILTVVLLQPKKSKPTNVSSPKSLVKKTIPTPNPTSSVSKVRLYLRPNALNIKLNQTFALYLALDGLKSTVRATDVVMVYDSALMEFVKVENTHPNYKNVRALINNNNTLILSFIKTETPMSQLEENMTLATLLFKSVNKGLAKIYPVYNNTPKSSFLFLEESLENRINNVDGAEIAIK